MFQSRFFSRGSLAAVAASLGLLALSACSGGGGDADPSKVSIEAGALQGVTSGDVVSFKGIPFAAAPVGNLRWRPPQAVTPWTTERVADKFGNDCMQATGPTPPANPVSEDCLYLNVWRPTQAAGPLPVMVWIYGGGYVSGRSSDIRYDGARFAKQGVVLVSLNYRVGRFGFFAHPALSAAAAQTAEPLGNYGYMDQIAALQWVKRNIGAFGGDPNNVTVFGESAGGESIHNLMTSPMAANLFQKAINESGNGRVNQAFGRYLHPTPGPPLPSAEDQGMTFAQQFGITGTDASALAALRALSSAQVFDNGGELNTPHGIATFAGGAIIDGKLVLDEPQVLYNKGQFQKVPVLLGTNDLDLGWPTPAATKDDAFAVFGAGNLAAARAAFDPQGTATVDQVRGQIGRVITMDEPARFVARVSAAQGLPTYLYRFSYVLDQQKATLAGAPHGYEMPFVFDTLDARYPSGLTARDRQVAATMQAYWVAFAKTGKPAPAGLPEWPAFNAVADNLLEFTPAGEVQIRQPGPLKAQIDLVQPLNEQNRVVNAQYGL
jgi:para-nitrobenzyl esterase